MRPFLALVALALVACEGSTAIFVDVPTPPEGDGGSARAMQAALADDAGSDPDAGSPSAVDPPDAAGDASNPAAQAAGPSVTRDAGAPADAGAVLQPPASGCVTVDGVISCGDCVNVSAFDASPYALTYECGSVEAQTRISSFYPSSGPGTLCNHGDDAGGLASPWSWCAKDGFSSSNVPLSNLPCVSKAPCSTQGSTWCCSETDVTSYR
jgi:hypothetical protein